MKYMLLIYVTEPATAPDPAAMAPMMEAYENFNKAVAEAGVWISGDALQGRATATTVRVDDDGARLVTDGPFAETREILGGYYVLDVPDLDSALDWAARCPGSQNGGTIEVRPLHEFPAG
ncbi:YciI family protein [Pseudonocardia sp. N23]|uniref:YciI family protein n=1 Tax=Pseudonocardia sp. N23 TaxID=1987376 RepID=UPI000C030F14|nr:YciI family protein [Pseudonocardia sp. N23]GAY13112.1 PhnB protein [Pseudonocardia sp. N23]